MRINSKNKINKILRGMALISLFIFAFAGTALADDPTRFVPGTKVNSIIIGGLTVEEAKTRIEGFYDGEYKLEIQEKDGKTEVIKGTDIGYKISAPEGLAVILDEQNAAGRVSGPAMDNSHTIQVKTQYDDGALAAKTKALFCVSDAGRVKTSDAHISVYQEGQPFTIIPEIQGNDVNEEKVLSALKEAAGAGRTCVNLAETGCYYMVNVRADNEQLKNLCDTMNHCKDMLITYSMGADEKKLTGDIICTWILGSVDGQINVNRDLAAAFVKSLAEQYDTFNRLRTFHTTGGKDVSLTGPYGWQINQATETDALIAVIRTGQSQTREPLYEKTASDRTKDWGNTYVEIDLTGQHAYMYKDGTLAWDAPCVSGNTAKKYTTPDGIYSLTYKEKDRILRGNKKPDGTYEYESHVNYWMPFNGGIGLHDADWRSKFGGTIYQNSGSHGCVNLPPAKAKELYDLIYKGIPVICYS